MRSRFAALAVLCMLALAASACGAASAPSAAPQAPASSGSAGGYGSGSGQAASPTQAALPVTGATATQASSAAMAPTGPAHVALGKNDQLGSFLVDDKGMTLYLFTKDSPNTSSCYGKCATFWPPLLTSGAPVGGAGLDASKFGTTTRTDGMVQVTYNGWPLYYFAKDKQAGDVNGQKVGGTWFVVSPSGDAIK